MRIITADGHIEWSGYLLKEDGTSVTDARGYCVRGPAPTVDQVRDAIWSLLTERERDAFEYLNGTLACAHVERWPQDAQHIFVASVEGGSEGDYIHVEASTGAAAGQGALILGKTFMGPDASWRLARRIAQMLGVSR